MIELAAAKHLARRAVHLAQEQEREPVAGSEKVWEQEQ
jgi:hypothetical protein